MSGILGLYRLDGATIDSEMFSQALDTMTHRGPDGAAIWIQGSVALGHRMLWTTPESVGEHLPRSNSLSGTVITADARVDNHSELISALCGSASSSTTVSDSELILAAYEKWGENCSERLIGDFAFAVWDEHSRTLFCARDHIGLKPFYYYSSPRLFAFASEIKALLAIPGIPMVLNETRVADHLASLFHDRVSTFYRGILRLPPAQSMLISPAGIRTRTYWSFDPSRELRLPTNEDYADSVREVFIEAVKCRLRSAFPVGAALSGGLDSSSIVCTRNRLFGDEKNGSRLHTFSAIFPNLEEGYRKMIDERKYVRDVHELGGFEPHFIEADRCGPFYDLRQVLWHEDEAPLTPNLYMHWLLYQSAQQQGVRVFLDGIDGDATVSYGLEGLSDYFIQGRWLKLLSEARSLSRKAHSRFTPLSILREYAVAPLVPESARHLLNRVLGRAKPAQAEEGAFNLDLAARTGLSHRIRQAADGTPKPTLGARRAHQDSLNNGMIPYALEKLNNASAAFSLEPRYPFFDRRMMELCLALPVEQKLQNGWTRWVMRRAMEGIVPRSIQWRFSKANLTPNFLYGLYTHDRSFLDQVLSAPSLILKEYVDTSALERAYLRFISDPLKNERDGLILYGATTLDRWLDLTGIG